MIQILETNMQSSLKPAIGTEIIDPKLWTMNPNMQMKSQGV